MAPSFSKSWLVAAAVILLIIMGLGVRAFSNSTSVKDSNPSKQLTQSLKVIIEPVSVEPEVIEFSGVASAHAKRSVELYPETSAVIQQIHVKPGDYVKKGGLILTLDSREQRLAVKLAEAEASAAKVYYQRLDSALSIGAVSQAELEAAKAAYDLAVINAQSAKLALEKQTVYAPFSGTVGLLEVEEGDRVDATSLITTLNSTGPVYLEFRVPESLAARLTLSNQRSVTAVTKAYPTEVFEGKVTDTDSQLSSDSNLRVRAEFDNSDGLIQPGMSFEVTWNVSQEAKAQVSELAVQWDQEGAYVWRVIDNKAVQTRVSVLSQTNNKVVLGSGLSLGDLVVVEGAERLSNQAQVEAELRQTP